MEEKIIRSLCYFTQQATTEVIDRLSKIAASLVQHGYQVQTQRVCTTSIDSAQLMHSLDDSLICSIGSITLDEFNRHRKLLLGETNISFNIDLTHIKPSIHHVDLLYDICRNKPEKCFNFTYVFNNAFSSPYFPAANYQENGFSLGLQPTNLSAGCQSLQQWLMKMKECWLELDHLFGSDDDFLGIDSSIAPLLSGGSSLIDFIKRLGFSFNEAVLSDMFIKMTHFIKSENPRSVGLCGLMLPCLEDFDLADEYSKGSFTVERNIFLSLHSGLGIDTYPIGVDESKDSILQVLRLLRGLSIKYNKPLSARFISDGQSTVGDTTNLNNPYLKDVKIRPLNSV